MIPAALPVGSGSADGLPRRGYDLPSKAASAVADGALAGAR
jgi:hypothetical protein